MRRPIVSGFSLDPRSAGPATKAFCLAILVVSVLGSFTQRTIGFGISSLLYDVSAILHLEVWRLLTYPFAIGSVFGLLIGVLVLFLFGQWFENSYGTRDFVRFFVASYVGAGLIAIPLHFLINALGIFRDVGMSGGPGPAIDAMLMALALNAPNSNVLFGFVLPVRARTIVYFIIGFEVIGGLMTGATTLGLTLGGLAMGYLLVTGNWRPSRWLKGAKGGRRRPRNGLYVVPPRDRTLH